MSRCGYCQRCGEDIAADGRHRDTRYETGAALDAHHTAEPCCNEAATVLVLTKSHRARERLFRVTGRLVCYNSWRRGSGFYFVPAEHLAAALAIKGVGRARTPNDLFKAWTPMTVPQGLFAFCPCCLREAGQPHGATCPDDKGRPPVQGLAPARHSRGRRAR